MLAIFTLLACTGTSDIDSGKGGTDSGSGDTDSGGGDTFSPVVVSTTTSCSPNTDGEDTWFIEAEVTDPQGDDTFQRGNLGVYLDDPSAGGDPVDEKPMVCTTGKCLVSWEDLTGKAGCSLAGKVWMRITVTDDDGNVSQPYDFQPTT